MPARNSATRRTRSRNRALRLATVTFTVALAATAALAQAPAKPKTAATPRPPNPDSVIATVGTLPIARAEFESRYARQRDEYAARSGAELAPEFVPIARRQVLEGLIQRELLRVLAGVVEVAAVEDELGVEAAHRGDLDRVRRLGDADRGPHAEEARRERDRLAVVAG